MATVEVTAGKVLGLIGTILGLIIAAATVGGMLSDGVVWVHLQEQDVLRGPEVDASQDQQIHELQAKAVETRILFKDAYRKAEAEQATLEQRAARAPE